MKPNRFVLGAVALLAMQGVTTATRAADQDAILARLDALEKENAALRQRLNRVERQATTSQRAVPRAAGGQNLPRASELDAPGSRRREDGRPRSS